MKGVNRDVGNVQWHLLPAGCGEAEGIKPGFPQLYKRERRRKREGRQEDKLGVCNTEVDVTMGIPAGPMNPSLLFSGLCLNDKHKLPSCSNH